MICFLFFSDIKNQFLRSLETSESSGCTEQKLTDLNAQKLNVEELIRQDEALGQGITCLVETRATVKEYSKFQFKKFVKEVSN